VKFCCIEGLNSVNSMPPWWMTAHWRKQYPKETHVLCDFNIESLWLSVPDTSYKYCPPYAAPNKAGRPKKNKRIKSALEVATEKKQSKQKKAKVTMDEVDGNLKSPPLIEVPGMVMVSGKKAKGTNHKVDGNLKSPLVFQVTGKVMVSGNIMSVENSGGK
jgi:hypothetical protein